MFAFADSARVTAFKSTFSGGPAFTPIGAGSLNYNNKAYVHVVELCANDRQNPIAQNAYANPRVR